MSLKPQTEVYVHVSGQLEKIAWNCRNLLWRGNFSVLFTTGIFSCLFGGGGGDWGRDFAPRQAVNVVLTQTNDRIDGKGDSMKIVLVRSPAFLTPLLRKVFGIRKK